MSRIRNIRYLYLSIFLSPLISLNPILTKVPWKYKKPLLIAVITIFGALLTQRTDSDGTRHLKRVYEYYDGLSFSDYVYGSYRILNFDPLYETNDDIYIHTVSYIAGGILRMPSLFFALVAFVFAFFYINAMEKVFFYKNIQINNLLIFFVTTLVITINFVDNMDSVRMWTGAWVMFYGAFRYTETYKKKYIILLACSIIFHASYIVVAIPAFIIVFTRNFNKKILIALYITSFLISFNPTEIIQNLNSNALGASKVEAYYKDENDIRNSEEILAKEQEKIDSQNFYKKYGKLHSINFGTNFFIISFILMGWFSFKYMTNLEYQLFSLGILMMTWGNLGSFIYAFYNRSVAISGIFIVISVGIFFLRGQYVLLKNNLTAMLLIWICVLTFFPFLIFKVANTIQYCSMGNLLLPIIPFMFNDLNFSIRDILGFIIFNEH